jgi:hypothetical protein
MENENFAACDLNLKLLQITVVKFRTTDIMEVDLSVLTTQNIYAGTTTTFPQSL